MTVPEQSLTPGMYVEVSPEGAAVFLVDEDGNMHESAARGVVDEDTPRSYYRVSDSPALVVGEEGQ